MAVGIVDRQKLVNIADAVRAKKGITGNMTLDAIASNITSMPTASNNAKYDFSKSGSKSSGNLLGYLTTVDLSNFDTSNYTSMLQLFYSCSSLTSLDVSNFNTSKVTNMNDMFNDCSSLTTLDVSNFNTSKVTSMDSMFNGCSSLTSLDVSNFNTSNVTSMGNMFNDCSSLTTLDVSNFNTSKVNSFYSFSYMFSGCSSLKTLDLSNFDFSNTYAGVYSGLYGMFRNCKSLETITFPSTVTFNNSGVCFIDMFYGCSSLTSLDLSGWDTSNVQYMGSMFYNCSELSNLTLGTDWASNSNIDSLDLSSCPLTRESALDVINKLATRSNSPVITFSRAVGLYQSDIDIATNKGWSVSGCTVLVDAETATVGQYTLIDGVLSKCVYVADTPQAWGQRIFASKSNFTDSNGNSNLQWGGYETATGITATAIGTGLTNTNALLAMNLKSTDGTPTIWDALAEFRSTYGDRWFIPSRDEGFESYKQGMSQMWTSSEYDSSNAYATYKNINNFSSKAKVKIAYAFTYV